MSSPPGSRWTSPVAGEADEQLATAIRGRALCSRLVEPGVEADRLQARGCSPDTFTGYVMRPTSALSASLTVTPTRRTYPISIRSKTLPTRAEPLGVANADELEPTIGSLDEAELLRALQARIFVVRDPCGGG
jgi:hypothetical protein